MSYAGNWSNMEDIWDWVMHPYSKEDEVLPRVPETERDYDPTMLVPPILVSVDEESFLDEEEPGKEERHANEIGGFATNNLPYLDSSSHHNREETQEEDLLRWSHTKRLLPYFLHPLSLFMSQYVGLSLASENPFVSHPPRGKHYNHHPRIHQRNLVPPTNRHPMWTSGSRRIILVFVRLESHPRCRGMVPQIERSYC